MEQKIKEKLKSKSEKQLESDLKKLEFELIGLQKHRKLGFNPSRGSPTKLIRDTRRNIAFIKTILNTKRQLKNSLELCKNKNSKRRERRLRGREKELKKHKKLKGGKR